MDVGVLCLSKQVIHPILYPTHPLACNQLFISFSMYWQVCKGVVRAAGLGGSITLDLI